MSRVVGYLRVSTSKQEVEKNKAAIRELADQKGFGMPEWVEEVISTRVHWQKRKIGSLLEELEEGDKILVSEMSRLGRSMLEIMTILQICTDKKIEVHAVKGDWSLDNTINSKIIAMAWSIAAEIERDLISKRTKESLKAVKAKGVKLGRKKGVSKLDDRHDEIVKMLKEGRTQKYISEVVGCTQATLSVWLKDHGISGKELREQGSKERRQNDN